MAGERKIVQENLRRVLLREYLMAETKRAGFGGLDIQRTPMGTRVTLIAERPGLVIGRKGSAIKALTEAVARDFSFDNPQIEVQEEMQPALNAQIMAEKLANALERGWHFRRAGHSTLRRVMESGAKGCLIIIAGKLTGQRHRTVKFKAGHVKYCGEPRNLWMGRGFAIARMKPGVIGVTVEIMNPNARLPDEIEVMAAAAKPAGVPAVEVAEVEAEAAVAGPPTAKAPAAKPKKAVEADAGAPVAKAPAAKPKETAEAKAKAEADEVVPKGKIAAKKLKKATQKLRKIGADVDLDTKEAASDEDAPAEGEE